MPSAAVRDILAHYDSESPGIRMHLARILMHGRLGDTGKLVILPVDQGVEHGPAQSFSANPAAYDPEYLFDFAIAARVSAFAAPYGLLADGAARHAGAVPLILKANNSNNLSSEKDQAVTATASDALRLGCDAIGYTIYPGADKQYEMIEETRAGIAAAREVGLPTVIWAYPRGGNLSKAGQTALDVVAYSAQIAAQLGAHIIKVKLPSRHIEHEDVRVAYAREDIDRNVARERVAHVMQSAFAGKRIVVFSGGSSKPTDEVLADVTAIRDGGGYGSIIGRNSFQRPRAEALDLLSRIMAVYEAPVSSTTQ
ncbi:class I fructose-bisphosphate aldolase [Pelagibacterium halotolerans]|uniref:class I fructose-bisphosphate aldolase n=1 Tax=Pelagibacterium halotolerans TaxID=531813 RepID=UPI003851564A